MEERGGSLGHRTLWRHRILSAHPLLLTHVLLIRNGLLLMLRAHILRHPRIGATTARHIRLRGLHLRVLRDVFLWFFLLGFDAVFVAGGGFGGIEAGLDVLVGLCNVGLEGRRERERGNGIGERAYLDEILAFGFCDEGLEFWGCEGVDKACF